MGRLDGKVAIISGAARGQGEQEARLFASEGALVMLTDVLDDQARAVADDIGDAARSARNDVASEDNWRDVVDATLAAFGRVDVLVNNAAIHRILPIEDETLADFERMVAINLTGTFLGIRSVIAPMRDAGGGSIVNISSLAGLTGYYGHGTYGATKWGVRGLTQVAAVELGPSRIRVNSVHPGPIDTDMLPMAPGDERNFRNVPLQRVGTPDEVAALVLFLASDESSYLSGAEITIDGGLNAGEVVPRRGGQR
jgi:3alpha(or 20beta)-hydroxysteroid dehydrogenase